MSGVLGTDYSWLLQGVGSFMFQRGNLARSIVLILKTEDLDEAAWGIARAITELNGIAPHVTPWSRHCELCIKAQWGDGKGLDEAWIEAWIVWFVGFVVEMERLIVENTGFRLGHGQFPTGYNTW